MPLQKINYDLAEEIAWPQQVALVAREYHALPPGQRATHHDPGRQLRRGRRHRPVRARRGLPPVFSGANNFWLWGPPPAPTTAAIAINLDPALLRREFSHVRHVATSGTDWASATTSRAPRIYLATGLRTSWAAAWPLLRDFS